MCLGSLKWFSFGRLSSLDGLFATGIPLNWGIAESN